MKIAIVGGGPGGLYLATLMKDLDSGHEITVWERNAPDDTFGFGVVFSDETLGSIEGADPVVHATMEQALLRAQAASIRVVRATRCAFGQVVPGARHALPDAGALSPVKARIALMISIMQG